VRFSELLNRTEWLFFEGFFVDLNDGVKAERIATVQELRDRQAHLCREISILLYGFESGTSLRVDKVLVSRFGDDRRILGVSVEVSL
jgi:hypothetical protein